MFRIANDIFRHRWLSLSGKHIRELTRIKIWMRAHRQAQPLECHTFDAVLTLWLIGWVGLLPIATLQLWWYLPLSLACAYAAPAYLRYRFSLHARGRVRCDWALS